MIYLAVKGLIDTHGRKGTCMDTHGRGGTCMETHGRGGTLIDTHGRGGKCMDTHGRGGTCMNMYTWYIYCIGVKCLDTHGSVGTCIDMHMAEGYTCLDTPPPHHHYILHLNRNTPLTSHHHHPHTPALQKGSYICIHVKHNKSVGRWSLFLFINKHIGINHVQGLYPCSI